MKFSPLEQYLLVEPVVLPVREATTAAGLYLPENNKERPDLVMATAVVLAVGPNVTDIKPKDRILYNFFSGNEYKELGKDPTGKDDKTYHFVWRTDVIAKEKK